MKRRLATGVRGGRGFTLIDVLVTITVIAILIAIMLPSLSSVRETAHQVVCRSNVRQMGFGVQMYSEANKGAIMYTGTTVSVTDACESMTLHYGLDSSVILSDHWDGIGLLYAQEYLPAAKIYYCPSHRGQNPFSKYEEEWGSGDGKIVGNFQYRGRAPTNGGTNALTNILDVMNPASALIADGMRTQSDFNHKVGANVLRADVSVSWFNDAGGKLLDQLAKDNEQPQASTLQNAWSQLDFPTR